VFVILNNSSYRILKQRLHAQRGLAAQVDRFVGMELVDPPIDYVGLARALGIAAERAKTVHETTDLIAQGLNSKAPLLIDVAMERNYKPV
jgi:benzoylformate decarboxylase